MDAKDTTLYVHAVDKPDLDCFQKMRGRVYYAPGQKEETFPSRALALEPDGVARLLTDQGTRWPASNPLR